MKLGFLKIFIGNLGVAFLRNMLRGLPRNGVIRAGERKKINAASSFD